MSVAEVELRYKIDGTLSGIQGKTVSEYCALVLNESEYPTKVFNATVTTVAACLKTNPGDNVVYITPDSESGHYTRRMDEPGLNNAIRTIAAKLAATEGVSSNGQ